MKPNIFNTFFCYNSHGHSFYARCIRAGVGLLLLLLAHTLTTQAQQAKVTITGTVSDKSSTEAMVGVGIMEVLGKDKKVIAVTDAKGNFSVKVSPEASLTFRYIGYREYTVKVRAGKPIDVRLSISESKLNETVIIGYQNKTRELTTGSSVIISGKDLQDVPVSNVEQLLQGRVPD